MTSNLLPLHHLVHQPTRHDYGARPPLLLLVHGFGSNEQDLIGLASYLDPNLLVVSARAPIALGQGAYAWFDIEFTPEGAQAKPEDIQKGKQVLLDFLKQLPTVYPVDPNRIFLGGFSQGAILSLSIALSDPELVNGITALSGRLWEGAANTATNLDALKGLPIFVSHGLWDNVLPITCGREVRDELSKLPVNLTYKEYPMAHEVSSECLADVREWVAEQCRKTK